MSNEPIQIKIDESVFQKRFDMGKRMGGHHLPERYLDFKGEFFPEAKEKEGFVYPLEGGILSCYKTYRFPTKGFPHARALESMNTIKKIIRESLGLLSTKPLRYFLLVILFLPKKTRKRILLDGIRRFVDTAEWIIGFHAFTAHAMCTSVREIYYKVKAYIDKNYQGNENDLYSRLLLTLCHFPELDSAYRYRAQDWAMIIDKKKLRESPAKELKRVFAEAMFRERSGGQRGKFDSAFTILSLLFKLKSSFRRKFVEIVDLIDLSGDTFEQFQTSIGVTIKRNQFNEVTEEDISTVNTEGMVLSSPKSRVGFDHADWYHCLNAPNYDFGGIPFGPRLALRRRIDTNWVEILKKRGAIKPE